MSKRQKDGAWLGVSEPGLMPCRLGCGGTPCSPMPRSPEECRRLRTCSECLARHPRTLQPGDGEVNGWGYQGAVGRGIGRSWSPLFSAALPTLGSQEPRCPSAVIGWEKLCQEGAGVPPADPTEPVFPCQAPAPRCKWCTNCPEGACIGRNGSCTSENDCRINQREVFWAGNCSEAACGAADCEQCTREGKCMWTRQFKRTGESVDLVLERRV
jgi:hypothetical protein